MCLDFDSSNDNTSVQISGPKALQKQIVKEGYPRTELTDLTTGTEQHKIPHHQQGHRLHDGHGAGHYTGVVPASARQSHGFSSSIHTGLRT